jgi:hypothetical protein
VNKGVEVTETSEGKEDWVGKRELEKVRVGDVTGENSRFEVRDGERAGVDGAGERGYDGGGAVDSVLVGWG